MRDENSREKEGSVWRRAAKKVWHAVSYRFGYKALALVTALLLWIAVGYLTRPAGAPPEAPESAWCTHE